MEERHLLIVDKIQHSRELKPTHTYPERRTIARNHREPRKHPTCQIAVLSCAYYLDPPVYITRSPASYGRILVPSNNYPFFSSHYFFQVIFFTRGLPLHQRLH